jgi:hypothetical protein
MYGLVAPNVDHLQLRFPDGTTSPVTIKSLGGYRFYAAIVLKRRNLTGVTAYDSAGKELPFRRTPGDRHRTGMAIPGHNAVNSCRKSPCRRLRPGASVFYTKTRALEGPPTGS